MTTTLQLYISSIIEQLNSRLNFGIGSNAQINNLTVQLGFANFQLDSLQNIILFLADIILFIGIITLLIDLALNFNKINSYNLLTKLTKHSTCLLYCSLVGLLFTFNFMFKSSIDWTYGIFILNSSYKIDMYTQFIKILIILVSLFLLTFLNISTKITNTSSIIELPLLFHIAIFLSIILVSCNNFVLLLLALEGFSLILYIMTTLERVHGGVTAAVKYFAFGTLGSILLFWGVAHIYATIPSLTYKVSFFLVEYAHINSIYSLISALEFAITVILIGFLIKLGAAPLHQWVPDVYSGSHIFVTAIFSTFVKFILFILFLKLAYIFDNGILIDFMAISSLVAGCYLTLKQSEIKRFLAYSSIVHVAFLLMGDINASIIYLLTYIISSLAFFSVIMSIQINGKELIYLNDLRFIRQTSYRNIVLIVISLASAAGLPPFAGFYGKYVTWTSLFEDIYLYNNLATYYILLTSIILSLVTIFYYMRIIAYLFISNDSQFDVTVPSNSINYEISYKYTSQTYIAQIIVGILLIFWTFIQNDLLNCINIISLSLIV